MLIFFLIRVHILAPPIGEGVVKSKVVVRKEHTGGLCVECHIVQSVGQKIGGVS